MVTAKQLLSGEATLSLVGLGYVGLPIAVSFSNKVKVVGFDVNAEKIELYKQGIDPTNEVGPEILQASAVSFTSNPADLKSVGFHIVAVPTPVNTDNTPDLSIVESASRTIGQNLMKGAVVVFESTVYPGVTEEICIPILEKESGMVCGVDFFVGYSPERINPGDKVHRLENIVKVVSGQTPAVCDAIAEVYEIVVEAGVYKASSIKVAEAAKVIENSQRDINIAFMNELSVIFKRMDIDTLEVLKAAGTKWNFLKFVPGLVGGHCIGVDPYYLTYRAQQLGYQPQVILSGRRINDSMGRFVAESAVKKMITMKKNLNTVKVGVLGLTFKEDCPDIRNTKVIDIIDELKSYGIEPSVCDPHADKAEAKEHYGLDLCDLSQLTGLDCLIVAVPHQEFYQLSVADYLLADGLLVDVKGIFASDVSASYSYWRL